MRKGSLVLALLGMLACVDTAVSPPVSPASASPRPSLATIAPSGEGRPIDGEYIVRFRDAEPDVDARVRALRGHIDGSIDGTYRRAIKGVFVRRLSNRAVAALRAEPSVVSVERNVTVAGTAVQPNAPWGVDRLDQRNLPLSTTYSYGPSGRGVTVYIIDSGINFSHVEFGGRATLGVDIVSRGNGGVDCSGHGTHLAGIAGGTTYGVAKNVRLVAVRVLDCATRGTTADVIAGIDWVTTHRALPAVANVSIGTSFSTTLNAAVRNSIASGVVYSIASGNSNADACTSSPSSTVEAITVAASDIYDEWATFSNNGSCVDLAAPGVGITSSWIGSPTATQSLYGTSFAAPHVAGAAALYLELHPSDSPAQVQAALVNNATTGLLSLVPAGSPNRLLYTGFMTGSAPPSPPSTNQPPVARFSVSCPTTQCAFDASASTDDAGIVRYDWNWGNGHTESHNAPTAKNTFSAGTYDVTLTVTDAVGAKGSLTRTIAVGAPPPPPPPPPPGNQAPTAGFSWTCAGQAHAHQCAFDASASRDDVGIVAYDWDWGNGRSESRLGPTARNSWASAGIYSVTLTVRDGSGATSSIVRVVAVP